jgi:hypothetical protein
MHDRETSKHAALQKCLLFVTYCIVTVCRHVHAHIAGLCVMQVEASP